LNCKKNPLEIDINRVIPLGLRDVRKWPDVNYTRGKNQSIDAAERSFTSAHRPKYGGTLRNIKVDCEEAVASSYTRQPVCGGVADGYVGSFLGHASGNREAKP
jgi:hypothetical protein